MAAAIPIEKAADGARHPDTIAFLKRSPKQLLIGGKWVPALSGKTFEDINPANEEVLALAAEADKADVDLAVKAARKAFEEGPWPKMNPHQRSRYILRIADQIEKHREELAELISLENGKTLREATGEVAAAIDMYIYAAGWATKIYGETNPSVPDMFNYTLREPVGVCGMITPWNAPLTNGSLEIGPALAAGCTMILKPGEQTPLVPVRLAELIMEAGIPEGVFNIITGYGETAGAAISNHPDVDAVAFTGSTEVGKEILRASAGNLKHTLLELGGKSPNVIFADADLDKALEGARVGIFSLSGQVCCATSRIFVQEQICDQFLEGMVKIAGQVKLGSPFDPATTMGPLVSKEQHDRVKSYLEVGKKEGANARIGGSAGDQPRGYFIKPTVFAPVNNEMRIAREEIFGPVASVIPFKNEEDAVLQGNDTVYGLAAIYTRDISRAHRVARQLKAGTVWINTCQNLDMISPFGGYKQSGFGRKRGKGSVEHYTHIKSVFVKL